MLSLLDHFSDLPDPRVDRTKLHLLIDIVTIALCAVICGAETYEEMETFGESKHEWLATFLELPNGIPSHDTFRRVLMRLNPQEFESRFLTWVSCVADLTQGEIVSIDGKTLRGSRSKSNSTIHMVSAWAAANRLVLGQVKTEDHSNEITAIPELLSVLMLKGCIVTIDAMGCQTEIARQIHEQDADYVLTLKANQPTTHQAVISFFDQARLAPGPNPALSFFQTVDNDHGRLETRRCFAAPASAALDPELLARWPGLTSVVKITATRDIDGDRSTESRYFLSTLPPDAQHLLSVVRTHWQIENCLHWVLDVAFREDFSRVRSGHAPHNFAILRHIALNLLKQETSCKNGIKSKRLKAGWDHQYLLKVINS